MRVTEHGRVPGIVLTYTCVFANSGVVQAYNVSIVDPIPASTNFALGSVSATLTNTIFPKPYSIR